MGTFRPEGEKVTKIDTTQQAVYRGRKRMKTKRHELVVSPKKTRLALHGGQAWGRGTSPPPRKEKKGTPPYQLTLGGRIEL